MNFDGFDWGAFFSAFLLTLGAQCAVHAGLLAYRARSGAARKRGARAPHATARGGAL